MPCATENWQRAGFGLYVHWPFCEAKCPYCDFNSHVQKSVDHAEWRAAFVAELRRVAAETSGRTLTSVFFGGGTPSLMESETVAVILDEAARHWNMAEDVEITLEANPSSVEASCFKAFRKAGVNRVSLGIQALDDTDLKKLGRLHSVSEALRAMEIARSTFDRASFDLIYARQDQSLKRWETELTDALSFDPEHLSLYQLTIEPETAFGRRYAKGQLAGLPDEDLAADMYFLTQEKTEAAGLPAYEISNHARAGAESRHNLIYWRGGDYVGIGPGAHGRFTVSDQRYATETHLFPAKWLSAVTGSGNGEALRDEIGVDEIWQDYLMMALRLREGANLSLVPEFLYNKIRYLCDLDLIEKTNSHLVVTNQGRPVLNAILKELLFKD